VTFLGALGSAGRARVDGRGVLARAGEDWSLEWWVGADDRWHGAASEVAVRQSFVDAAPVTVTSMRVPSGDAVQRAYGVGTPAGLVVVELENASPVAFVAGFVVRGARSVEVDGRVVVVDGSPALVLPFVPPRWVVSTGSLDVPTAVLETGPLPATSSRRRDVDAGPCTR
jgi:hypothetical protein